MIELPTATASAVETIRICGARVHNLKNIDVEIPRERLVVITGPSGSGKSSLAFDTLFAEGQRQYVESLSVYARQFLHQLERPDVSLIEGLQPTISIDQRGGSQNPRSTVATVTEIYDYLRLLFARVGQPHCPQCGSPICRMDAEDIQELLMAMPEGSKVIVLAPLVRGRKGEHKDVLADARKAGFVRIRIDGQVYELDHVPELAMRKEHHIEAVVDRLVIRQGLDPRVAEAVSAAVKYGDGLVIVATPNAATGERTSDPAADRAAMTWTDRLYSTRNACPNCKTSFEEIEPRTFSFNSPYGACLACDGLGARVEFDPDLLIPDRSLSLAQGAVLSWKAAFTKGTAKSEAADGVKKSAELRRIEKQLAPFLKAHKFTWDTPLDQLTAKTFEQFLRGDGKKFLGVLTLLEQEYVTATMPAARHKLEAFRGVVTCPECGGARLRPEARACTIAGQAIHQVTALNVTAARVLFEQLEFEADVRPIAEPIVGEIVNRLRFLEKVGVAYLTLDRAADSLSGGELQRVRLATGIGSGLVGVCYVLDEPSIGLHPRDNQQLIDALRDLQQQGNTVLVVEHDEAMMRAADYLIDMGPGAGAQGGEIVAAGTPDEVARHPGSITGRYLTGELAIPVPAERRRAAKTRALQLEGVTTNNLQNVSALFPLGTLTCVTGVSGSGKSSLVNETLARAVAHRLGLLGPKPGPHASLRGVSQIARLVEVNQARIGRTPRSNPATYTGAFDEIRKIFAGAKQAKQLGYKPSRFSFNAKGGRCEACQGQGVTKIEMNFLPDLYVACPECNGARFNRQTLQVRYKGKSIAEVLDLRVEEAAEFFANFTIIARLLDSLQDVGLGYLTLGQQSTTLSGGEAQRIKLATELSRVESGSALYILDEPTTGLHFDDIRRLLIVLQRLVEMGNTVIVIEHNLDVIKSADWLIDLGPEGGQHGGQIVAAGTPEEIALLDHSHTGRYLRPVLAG